MPFSTTASHHSSASNRIWSADPLHTTQTIVIAHHCASRRAELQQLLDSSATYRWVEATTTTEALTAVSQQQVDLVLIALDIPELGAVDFCRILHNAPKTRFLSIFVISNIDDPEAEVRAIEAGADSFFVEPIRPAPMQARIQATLKQKFLIESLDDSETVLFSLAQSVEERDPDLGQHCERLAHLCSAMGLALHLPPHDILTLQRAGYLHDIGKVAIPDDILFKRGTLTPYEWRVMQSHVERGERICRNMRSLAAVLPVIRHHHEKWDGTGYPDGLAGENIPLLARILQIADIYDALTTARPYKRAFSDQEAIAILKEEAKKGWRDPVLTDKFLEMLPKLDHTAVPDFYQLSLRALAHQLEQNRKAAANSHSRNGNGPAPHSREPQQLTAS